MLIRHQPETQFSDAFYPVRFFAAPLPFLRQVFIYWSVGHTHGIQKWGTDSKETFSTICGHVYHRNATHTTNPTQPPRILTVSLYEYIYVDRFTFMYIFIYTLQYIYIYTAYVPNKIFAYRSVSRACILMFPHLKIATPGITESCWISLRKIPFEGDSNHWPWNQLARISPLTYSDTYSK